MSYILEALRRSQAERERGQVPGLDAQQAGSNAPAAPHAGMAVPWPVLAAVLVLALVLGAGAVWLWRGAAPAALSVVAVPGAAAPQVTLPVPGPVLAPLPAPAPLPVVVSAPALSPPSVQAPAAPAPAPASTPAGVAPVATPVPAAPAGRAAPRALSLAELTPEQRRDLPPLVMGGSIWSDSVLGRFVIVNGQVVREGEAAANGVTVERITPKTVLLRWRDMRFEVPL